MARTFSALLLIAIIFLLTCGPGEGGNHPAGPPGSVDTTKKDTVKKDSL